MKRNTKKHALDLHGQTMENCRKRKAIKRQLEQKRGKQALREFREELQS